MFIGTLWCGRGNIARDDSELGVYSELDTCCRTHDRCEDYINPKATKYGLYNKYICRRYRDTSRLYVTLRSLSAQAHF